MENDDYPYQDRRSYTGIDSRVAILETQVKELTRRTNELEIQVSQILEKDIKPLTAWKNTAFGYCLGISVIGTFVMNKALALLNT